MIYIAESLLKYFASAEVGRENKGGFRLEMPVEKSTYRFTRFHVINAVFGPLLASQSIGYSEIYETVAMKNFQPTHLSTSTYSSPDRGRRVGHLVRTLHLFDDVGAALLRRPLSALAPAHSVVERRLARHVVVVVFFVFCGFHSAI